MFISRIAHDKREQPTAEHLAETAKQASDWAEPPGFKQIAFHMGSHPIHMGK